MHEPKPKTKPIETGCILLNAAMTDVVLVKCWKGNSRGLPKGKINQGEPALDAAIREVRILPDLVGSCRTVSYRVVSSCLVYIPLCILIRETTAFFFAVAAAQSVDIDVLWQIECVV